MTVVIIAQRGNLVFLTLIEPVITLSLTCNFGDPFVWCGGVRQMPLYCCLLIFILLHRFIRYNCPFGSCLALPLSVFMSVQSLNKYIAESYFNSSLGNQDY